MLRDYIIFSPGSMLHSPAFAGVEKWTYQNTASEYYVEPQVADSDSSNRKQLHEIYRPQFNEGPNYIPGFWTPLGWAVRSGNWFIVREEDKVHAYDITDQLSTLLLGIESGRQGGWFLTIENYVYTQNKSAFLECRTQIDEPYYGVYVNRVYAPPNFIQRLIIDYHDDNNYKFVEIIHGNQETHKPSLYRLGVRSHGYDTLYSSSATSAFGVTNLFAFVNNRFFWGSGGGYPWGSDSTRHGLGTGSNEANFDKVVSGLDSVGGVPFIPFNPQLDIPTYWKAAFGDVWIYKIDQAAADAGFETAIFGQTYEVDANSPGPYGNVSYYLFGGKHGEDILETIAGQSLGGLKIAGPGDTFNPTTSQWEGGLFGQVRYAWIGYLPRKEEYPPHEPGGIGSGDLWQTFRYAGISKAANEDGFFFWLGIGPMHNAQTNFIAVTDYVKMEPMSLWGQINLLGARYSHEWPS